MYFVICLLTHLLVAPLIFHQFVETAFPDTDEDRNRALLTYNLDTDLCREVPLYSNNDTKKAANKACAMAFHALDRLDGNSCDRWRDAECRLLIGFNHLQCTCLMPASVYVENRNHDVIAFRECAWKLYTQEVIDGQAPIVSPNFQQRHLQIHYEALEKARSRSGASTASGPGSSQVSKRKRTEGDFSGATTSAQGGSASWGVEIPGFLDISATPGPSASPAKKRSRKPRKPFYPCEVCGQEFSLSRDLTIHAKSHEPEPRCSICNQLFAHRGTLKSHMRKCQRAAIEPPVRRVTREKRDGPYVCTFCGTVYKWEKSLIAHIKVHNDQGQCEICGATFSTAINYTRHLKDIHPKAYEAKKAVVSEQVVPRGPYACDICEKSYGREQSLKEHQKKHEGETRCTSCNAVLASPQSLKRHKKSSHPEVYEAEKEDAERKRLREKPFECETCGARFALRGTLTLHQAVHRGETKCSHCDKVFPRKTVLKMHIKNEHS